MAKDRRAESLTSKRATFAVFVQSGSPRILLAFASVAVLLRLAVARWSWADLLMLAVTLVLAGFVEWTIHLFLLHAPQESFRMRVLKTGTGHRLHHLDPGDIDQVLLKPADAALFSVMFVGFTAGWSVPLLWLTGSSIGPGFLTALALAYVGLAHYEWTHLLVHASYRPRTPYYRRLARNHRLHHYRNENYWLGVTTNSGDRVLRTLPRSKSDVPLSETTRTLAGLDR